GDAPVAAVTQFLRGLEAVTEKARGFAETDRQRCFEAGIASRTRARQHALSDAVLDLRDERIRREAEHQDAHAGAAIWSFMGRQITVDAALRSAADDGGAKAGGDGCGNACPFKRVGRNDDAGAAHAEGFGKGIVDGDAVDRHAHDARAPVGWITMEPRPRSMISSSGKRKFSIRIVR